MVNISVRIKKHQLSKTFSISRGASNSIEVVEVEIKDKEGHVGAAECRPYPRFDETATGVLQSIKDYASSSKNLSRDHLQENMEAGAARHALDCAFWDIEAKQSRNVLWMYMGMMTPPQAVPVVQTLSLDKANMMAKAALSHKDFSVLKLKLGGSEMRGDFERLDAVMQARPDAKLMIDANEGWDLTVLDAFLDKYQDSNLFLIEQPLPEKDDAALADIKRGSILISGDESIRTLDDVKAKQHLYDVFNIKLDKAGGLTHGLEMQKYIQGLEGKSVLVGCMVSSSLAMRYAFHLAQNADYADLDGATWLAQDSSPRVVLKGGFASLEV